MAFKPKDQLTHALRVIVTDHHTRIGVVHERCLTALIPASDERRVRPVTLRRLALAVQEARVEESLEREDAGRRAEV